MAVSAAGLALLLSVHAIWLDRVRADDDARWRDEFERPFADYVRGLPR